MTIYSVTAVTSWRIQIKTASQKNVTLFIFVTLCQMLSNSANAWQDHTPRGFETNTRAQPTTSQCYIMFNWM